MFPPQILQERGSRMWEARCLSLRRSPIAHFRPPDPTSPYSWLQVHQLTIPPPCAFPLQGFKPLSSLQCCNINQSAPSLTITAFISQLKKASEVKPRIMIFDARLLREEYRKGFIIHRNAYSCSCHLHHHILIITIIIFTTAGQWSCV